MNSRSRQPGLARRLAPLLLLVACLVVVSTSATYFLGLPATRKSAGESAPLFTGDKHPLDDAIAYAGKRTAMMRAGLRGYTAEVEKRERINGKVIHEKMEVKVLNRKIRDGKVTTPLSVYLKFLAPKVKKGREVIYVENRNDGKLVAHEAGMLNVMRANLEPTGRLAMLGNRYPITEIGLENLADKLVERGKADRKWAGIEVEMTTVNGPDDRPCKLIEIRHPRKWPEFDFYLARIYIDEALNVPVRYSAYTWPEKPGGEPVLEEEYIYTSLKLNPGLTDTDFDPDNKAYKFP